MGKNEAIVEYGEVGADAGGGAACGSEGAGDVPVGQGFCPCRSDRDVVAARPVAGGRLTDAEAAELLRGADSGVRPDLSRRGYRLAKRAFDIVFSLCVLTIAFVPGLILCAFVLRDTGGNPIYTQERVGMGGRVFRVYKFRTMVVDSDDVEKYLDAEQLEQWRRERKVDDDPRITPLGSALRRSSLDEAPQFLNVLKGDMSVVGPRAITRDELETWFALGERVELLSVPAGITGLWQVTQRNDATFESGERQRIELEYVRSANLRTDAQLFFKTFSVMFGKEKTGR